MAVPDKVVAVVAELPHGLLKHRFEVVQVAVLEHRGDVHRGQDFGRRRPVGAGLVVVMMMQMALVSTAGVKDSWAGEEEWDEKEKKRCGWGSRYYPEHGE